MKKRILILFLSVFVGLTSCKKENKITPTALSTSDVTNYSRIAVVTNEDNDYSYAYYSYNADGRIDKIVKTVFNDSTSYVFSYPAKNKVIKKIKNDTLQVYNYTLQFLKVCHDHHKNKKKYRT